MNPAWFLVRLVPVALALFSETLRLQDDAAARQTLLAGFADRLVGDVSHSDVDVLEELVAWDALWLSRLPAEERWNRLTGDLVRVCTERDVDARSVAKDSPYRPGRFRDRGFAPHLRDGGDQVRHFCWAVRVGTIFPPGVSGLILTGKELRDGSQRNVPPSAADLALNRTALRLVAGVNQKMAKGEADATPWAQRFREALTAPPPTSGRGR
jgi:hypothetical protein